MGEEVTVTIKMRRKERARPQEGVIKLRRLIALRLCICH